MKKLISTWVCNWINRNPENEYYVIAHTSISKKIESLEKKVTWLNKELDKATVGTEKPVETFKPKRSYKKKNATKTDQAN